MQHLIRHVLFTQPRHGIRRADNIYVIMHTCNTIAMHGKAVHATATKLCRDVVAPEPLEQGDATNSRAAVRCKKYHTTPLICGS